MKYLIDTNVLRELGKTVPHKNVVAWLKGVDDADLSISARDREDVTKLRKTKPETAAALDTVVTAIFDAFEGRILPIERIVARAWGEALAESDKHVNDVGLCRDRARAWPDHQEFRRPRGDAARSVQDGAQNEPVSWLCATDDS